MSFREVRNLTEKLRTLGYGSVVSMEAFRAPNFTLVADILAWLVLSYDPDSPIPRTVSNEDERVAFVTSIAEFLATRAQIKLNPLKLYRADGGAVREIMKLIEVFTFAQSTLDEDDCSPVHSCGGGLIQINHHNKVSNKKPAGASIGTGGSSSQSRGFNAGAFSDISSKNATIRAAREISSDLTSRGAQLYDLLASEPQDRDLRSSVLSKAIDIPSIKSAAEEILKFTREEVQKLTDMVTTMEGDKLALISKTEKKRVDLDRRSKRLKSLKGVRPAYMDEFERIESELKLVYANYVKSIKNLAFLENQVEETDHMEQNEAEETERSLKKLQEKVQQEERDMLRGQVAGMSESEDDESYGFGLDGLGDSLIEDSGPESSSLRKKSALYSQRASREPSTSRDSSGVVNESCTDQDTSEFDTKKIDDSERLTPRPRQPASSFKNAKNKRPSRYPSKSRTINEEDEDSLDDEDSELDDDLVNGRLRNSLSTNRQVLQSRSSQYAMSRHQFDHRPNASMVGSMKGQHTQFMDEDDALLNEIDDIGNGGGSNISMDGSDDDF